jgi:hypothetical protein
VIKTLDVSNSASFYVIGGTLQRDARSYVAREADSRLYSSLTNGEFCYVLTARQMGKSSLMVQTAARLREDHTSVAVLDLTALGQNLSVEQWYLGLLDRIGEQLDLEAELEELWDRNQSLGPLQRWMVAVRSVVLEHCPGRVVVFIDEIDAVRSLPFSTDEFFAGIRELYNRRAHDPDLSRLAFCLLGVATPSDLIRDTRTTPFNIGRRIELSDFTEEEAAPLAVGMGGKAQSGRALLSRVLYWTGGHPYLTQRLCRAVAEDARAQTASVVDRICNDLFLSLRAREHDDNLLFVRERMIRSEVDTPSLLSLYDKIRSGAKVRDDETNSLVQVLRLSGITRPENAFLRVRNRIYERVFDRDWVTSNLPGAELRRQKAAYKRGLKVAALVAVPLFIAGAYLYLGQYRITLPEGPATVFKAPVAPPFWASFSAASGALMNTGSLLVDVGEKNVTIFVNDQEYGRTAQEGALRIDGIQAGSYRVRVEKPGFQTVSLPVEVKAQSETPLLFKLQEQSKALALGSVSIQGAPPGATVGVDGKDLGVTSETGAFSFTAPPGEHTLRIAKDGFVADDSKFQSVSGEKIVYTDQPRKDAEYQRWQLLANSNDAQALAAFLRENPNGRFASRARDRVEQLEWDSLKNRNDSGVLIDLDNFLGRCRGSVCAIARAQMDVLKGEEEEWISDRDSGVIENLQRYLSKYPQGRYSQQAHAEIAHLTDDKEIREIVSQYERAYNRKDIEQLISLWPTFPSRSQERTRALFKAAKSISLTLSIVGDVNIRGNVAVVTCKRIQNVVRPDEGGGLVQDSVEFKLGKQGDRWIVESAPH